LQGWARQPGARTVEGELRRGLVRMGVAASAEALRLEVASRTDRGVSARRNAVALSSDLEGPPLLRAMNGVSPQILCTASTPVPDGFRVRAAVRRVYRYFEPAAGQDFQSWQAAAALFRDRVDVRSFGRSIAGAAPVWRTVESVTVLPGRAGALIEVRAPAFVWGMVRKIVAALREHEAGRLPLARLEAAILGRERLSLPLAEPERLTLWEVEYPIPWRFRWAGPNRHQAAYLRKEREALWARDRILRGFEGAGNPLRVADR
jgi:tRNA pseudouridine38-40 synthase